VWVNFLCKHLCIRLYDRVKFFSRDVECLFFWDFDSHLDSTVRNFKTPTPGGVQNHSPPLAPGVAV